MRKELWIVCAITFGFAKCLTIDNQLTVIRNDCYERLAIGEKLDPKDVDKTLVLNTVQDCQMACTQEQEKCRSFSFGLGVKGNASCELSKHVVKETPDLKPIGTISDIDYDLYIKKLGCKLVLNKEPGNNSLQTENPSPHNYDKHRPSYKPAGSASNNHHNNYNRPSYGQSSQFDESSSSIYAPDRPYRVQSSLISIASNPNKPSRPLPPSLEKPDDYRIENSAYGMGRPYYPNRFDRPDFDRPYGADDYRNDRPPFRPTALNHPYNFNYRPEFNPERPPFLPERFPSNDRLDFGGGYGQGSRPIRPDNIPERPIDPNTQGYVNRPNRPHFLPDRPLSSSDMYNSRPSRPDVIPERPLENEYRPRPIRPPQIPERPLDNFGEYNHGSRPHRPHNVPERPLGEYGGSIPHRPDGIPERPMYETQGHKPRPPRPERPNFDEYDQGARPQRPHDIPERPSSDQYGSTPNRPDKIPERPQSDSQIHDYGPKPSRPHDIPERPINNFDSYGQGSRPQRPHDIPERPSGGGYGPKSNRPDAIPQRPFDDYGPRPQHPHDIPERPLESIHDHRPRPPYPHDIHDRPAGDGYNSRPHRPDRIPERPLNDDYRPIPVRPYDIPERPLGDFNSYGPGSHRPFDTPEQFLGDQYDRYDAPPRPQALPERPDFDDYGGGLRPHRPERPISRPDKYGYGDTGPYGMPESPPADPYMFQHWSRPFPPRNPSEILGSYGPKPHRPERPIPYEGENLHFKPMVYDTDFKRPVFIPVRPDYSNGYEKPPVKKSNATQNGSDPKGGSTSNNTNTQVSNSPNEKPSRKPIVTQVVGPYGQTITSIITEIKGGK